MGNPRKAYKPNSRTRQKRAAARRDFELEEFDGEVPSGRADTATAAPERRGWRTLVSLDKQPRPADQQPRSAQEPPRRGWRALVSLDRQPRPAVERDSTPWSRRGLATLSLIAAVVCVPLGLVQYFSDHQQYALGAYIVAVINPAALIPFFLVLSMLLAMPLAKALAREPRSLRILETLGYAATVQILLIFFWSPVYQVNARWFDNGKGALAGAAADVLALGLGALVYGPISRFLTRRRPPRRT